MWRLSTLKVFCAVVRYQIAGLVWKQMCINPHHLVSEEAVMISAGLGEACCRDVSALWKSRPQVWPGQNHREHALQHRSRLVFYVWRPLGLWSDCQVNSWVQKHGAQWHCSTSPGWCGWVHQASCRNSRDDRHQTAHSVKLIVLGQWIG